MSISAESKCLFGAVSMKAGEMSPGHCSMCRKWSGSPLLTVDCHDSVSF